METIVIGKPAINIYLPLQEYPQEGDLFLITGKNESMGNVGATSACMLSRWKMPVHFTGVVGNDSYAEKVRTTFQEFKVNTKFLEIDYEAGTAVNYNILNVKSGIVTKVLYNNPASQLKRYKYDFNPGFAILDGTDFAGSHALLNNNGSIKSVFYARTGDKDTIAMSKRCTWVICTEKFVEMLTRETADGTAEGYVALYQKIVDAAGKSNYIVILNNHKILYCIDGKVKMLPEMKISAADYSSFDSIFTGAFSFCMMNDVELDDAIKFANTAAAISLTRIGEVAAIPTIDEVLDNSGLRDKLGMGKNYTPGGIQPATKEELDQGMGVVSETPQPAPVQEQPVEQQMMPQEQAMTQEIMPQQTMEQQVPQEQPVMTPEMAQPAEQPADNTIQDFFSVSTPEGQADTTNG